MSYSKFSQNQIQAQIYFEAHQIEDHVNNMLNSLAHFRPEDPKLFMVINL